MPFTPVDSAWNIIAALIVLVLPGAAWLVWFPGSQVDPGERLADAIGISISFTTLLGLVAFLAGFQWVNETFLSLLALGLLVVLLLGVLLRFPVARARAGQLRWPALGASLLGLVALVGLILWRFYQARSLVLPAWVDSVHHTLIVRIILEKGGLPATLDPQIPAVFSYHYGFHLVTALFATWSRSLPADAVLWLGQVINALVALSIYRLGKTLWQDARPAAAAALLVGLAFHMPAYYLTWGRYTLLTGLLLLPLAMAAALQVSRTHARTGDWLRLALLTVGVALSHYTALLLLGFFMMILLVGKLLGNVTRKTAAAQPPDETPQPPALAKKSWLDGLWQPASAALLGLLLVAPWLARVWQQQSYQANLRVVSPLDASQLEYGKYILYLLGPLHNEVLLGIAAAGLIAAFFYRSTRVLAAWGLLLALLTLPWGLRLGPFRPDHMAIVLFVPASLLIGGLLFSGIQLSARLKLSWLHFGIQGVMLLAVLGLICWGMWSTRDVLNPSTVFTTQADVDALRWVEDNTPPDAIFLINTTPWMGLTYRGVDGGYWLEPYTGRAAILPPALYTDGGKEYAARINQVAQRASQLNTCDENFWSLVDDTGVSFLYVREGQGSLKPEALADCQDLVTVYRRGGVYIYEIN